MIKDINIIAKRWLWRTLREGHSFRKITAHIRETEGLCREDIERLQAEKLRSVIRHCYRNVPYYRRLFDSIGLGANNGFSSEDMKKIPLLTRDKLLRNSQTLLSGSAKKILLRKAHSSGTTGSPVTLYRDLYSINFENAVFWRQRNWAGINYGDRKATLRGELILPGCVKRPPFWKYDYAGKELILSSFHISKENAPYYVYALKRFKPVYVEGYPSSLYILAKFIKEAGLKPVNLKAIITSSETLEDYRRSLIEEVFKCRIFDFYGSAERVIAIATCPRGNYHILPEYGYTEFLDYDNNNGYKELVGTAFFNNPMPLVRYRTQDLAVPSERVCECGMQSRLVERIIGRLSDFIVTPTGRYLATMDCIYKGIANIAQAQMVQEEKDAIRVKLVVSPAFSEADKHKLTSKISDRVGPEMKIYVENVDSIERTRNGKFRSVISNIGNNGYE